MQKEINTKLAFGIVIGLAVVFSTGVLLMGGYIKNISDIIEPFQPDPVVVSGDFDDFEKFKSEKDFKQYLAENELDGYYGFSGGFGRGGIVGIMEEGMDVSAMPTSAGKQDAGGGDSIDRISETNVQVSGIDEPDIVKTDGNQIYFSPEQRYYWRGIMPMVEKGIAPDHYNSKIKVVSAFPPADLGIVSEIDLNGNLLLNNNILAVLANNKITGIDVSDSEKPEEKWEIDIQDNNYLSGARLYNNKLYIITQQRINSHRPCPIIPVSVNGASIEIACSDIYRPGPDIAPDITYTAIVVDFATGEAEGSVSLVASSGSSVLYVSETGIYITYSYTGDLIKFFSGFFEEKCEDIIPQDIRLKIKKLADYDISKQAKYTELQVVLEQFRASLTNDESMRIENELSNRINDYYAEHQRELEKTGIAKIGLSNLEIIATGEAPGRLLNQFSLDEYNGNLRVAITVGSSWGILGNMGESVNDVYVLDNKLNIIGSVQDLGLGERVYSARFIADKGYVVTFKQIDPFYVLDLSDPKNPEVKGELKIPGYSSYLHPITNDKILGIGKQGSKVKISLFDVANPEDPQEVSKYTMDEYWSDVLNTHHAFLLDSKHNVFFMPGGKGGYIFSYENDKLKLERAVSNIQAKRAVYINDYLYIIGEDEIIVLNEIDWEQVNSLDF